MSEVVKSPRSQLDEWESRIKLCVGEGDLLLGELDFVRQDLNEISNLLKSIFQLRQKHYLFDSTLHHIRRQWPLTYALYLVLEGVYQYNSEEQYWHGPIGRMGINRNQTSRLGQEFLDILAKHNLPTFEQSGGYTYVTPILLHGGIPNEFLPEFFDFLLRQEVKPHRVVIDTESLLQLWRKEADVYLIGLPRAVQRFLQHGGLVATDMVSRCLELLRADGAVESMEMIDLPNRILRIYKEWRQDKEIELRPSRSRIRLQKPILALAPYTTGVTLYLPPQQFPTSLAPTELSWHLQIPGKAPQVTTTRQRIEGGYHYAASTETAMPPARQYTLQLYGDNERLQEWALPGIDTPPLLIFAPYDDYEGDALSEQERYRPGERWLLYPENYQWKQQGQSRKIRDLPRLPGIWQSYKLEQWHLAPGEMVLQAEKNNLHLVNIIHEKIHHRPTLTGGNRLPLPTLASDFPLYIGRPPSLALHSRDPHRWRLTLRAAGESRPQGVRHYRLSQLKPIQNEGVIQLDLASPHLLGETAVGRFEIVLRGPLGQFYNLGLRLIPFLEVEGLNQLYLENANAPAHFHFNCDAGTELRQNPPQAGVALQSHQTDNGKAYHIQAQPDIEKLNLQLRHNSGVMIPLTIPIHRLRWGLQQGANEDEVNWHTEALAIFPGSLLNAELWVDVPLISQAQLQVGWQLLDTAGNVCRSVLPGEQPVQRRLEVSLTEVTDSWRERQETLCWQLIIDAADSDEPLFIPAFYLLSTPDFGDLKYDWRQDNEKIYLTLLWERPQPGNYQLHFWPLDRPWVRKPVSILLPQTTDNLVELEWPLSDTQSVGQTHLANLAAHNPWQSSLPERPQPGNPNTLILKPPNWEAYYDELTLLRDMGEATIEQLLTLLVHQFYNHKQGELYNTNQAIAAQRHRIPLRWLIHWLELTHALDKTAYRLVQLRAFDQMVIERLAKEAAPALELERYFAHLPDKFIEKLHLWVLQSGLPQARKHCLRKLCELSPTTSLQEAAWGTAMNALLKDVGDGTLHIREAILMLTNPTKAAEFLAEDGSQDAAELLEELVVCANLQPTWIVLGMLLDSDLGRIAVEKLRHRTTQEIRFCALLKADYYADGKLLLSSTAVAVRLDLHNHLVHFNNNNTPYLCHHCSQLFTVRTALAEHHTAAHPEKIESYRRLRRDEKVNRLIPHLPDEYQEALS
jgi:hypothetical protein